MLHCRSACDNGTHAWCLPGLSNALAACSMGEGEPGRCGCSTSRSRAQSWPCSCLHASSVQPHAATPHATRVSSKLAQGC